MTAVFWSDQTRKPYSSVRLIQMRRNGIVSHDGPRTMAPSHTTDMATEPQLHTHPGDELVERERLREIVVRTELEPAQLRRHVRTRGEDHDRQLGTAAVDVLEQLQAVEPWQLEVEHDELVRLRQREGEADGTVIGAVDGKALRLEPQPQEGADPGLVLDD